MPTITTYAKPQNDFLVLHVPQEYRSYSFQVVLIPKLTDEDSMEHEAKRPSWASLCENAITRNADGPHDMASIRNTITSAELW